MTTKSIGLLSMAVACATAISISASSCDNNPTTPGGKSPISGGKGPQVLDGNCGGDIASRNCGVGKSSIRYDEEGNMQVSNMDDPSSGVNSVFADPINYWHASVEAEFPADGSGSLSYSAQDGKGNTQARMDITQKDGETYEVRPTFTSNEDGGTPYYDVQILDDRGGIVARQDDVDISQSVAMRPDRNIPLPPTQPGWGVFAATSQCIWSLQTATAVQWTLPNGITATGVKVKMTEKNSQGFYPYIQSGNILTNGVVASYTVKSASGVQSSK